MFVEKQQKNRKWEFTFRKCKLQHKKKLNVLNTEIAIFFSVLSGEQYKFTNLSRARYASSTEMTERYRVVNGYQNKQRLVVRENVQVGVENEYTIYLQVYAKLVA